MKLETIIIVKIKMWVMIRLRLILHSMLSLPVVKEAQEHYVIVFCALAYCSILFLVLKTLKYNKDSFDD